MTYYLLFGPNCNRRTSRNSKELCVISGSCCNLRPKWRRDLRSDDRALEDDIESNGSFRIRLKCIDPPFFLLTPG